MWNLAVLEDETYVAGGVAVHNCRSMLVPVTLDVPIDEKDVVTAAEADDLAQMVDPGFGGTAKGPGARVVPKDEDLRALLDDIVGRIDEGETLPEDLLRQARDFVKGKRFKRDDGGGPEQAQ